MNLNKKQLLKQTISLLLIVAMIIPMFTRVSSCCDKSEKYSCSEKNSDSIQFEKNCDLCDFQFSSLSFYTPKEIDFIVFKKIITDDNQPILPQYSSFYLFNKQLRAPPVYSS
tara:strand:+ start:2455 stop:2790 length:336 start_codon:yes stop_codon:yes gene_type:complete